MTVYLTWPQEAGEFGAAAIAGEVNAICAERASIAAQRRALKLGIPHHPYGADVMVMPAHQVGNDERPRCYTVRFSRGIESVKVMP